CAACSVAAATALVGTPTTFDATATPQAAKVLTFQFNFTAATAALPAGNYVDTITVDVTAL
ncbi:MAG: hypothetical protein OEW08_04285, partial [Gammaproteobacteria bacterium]|nr:hypothetical protein [Gammaproteobacteria bacterium]